MPDRPAVYRPAKSTAPVAGAKRRSRHARGYGSAWVAIREQVLADEPTCRECAREGIITAAKHVDHITPKARGGTDDRANLQPLCQRHHDLKTAAENRARVRPRS